MSGKVGDNPYRASGVVAPVASDAYNDDQIQSNIAILGFYVAVNGSLVKYNLVDQTIDEYFDTSGVDASASTNEARSGVSPYYYYGVTSSTPSVTEDADETGTDGDYSWYKWTDTASTGAYNNDTTQDHEYLIVAGGGSGGQQNAGAGGAGGYRAATGLSLTGGNDYTITVGAGGAGQASANTSGNVGSDSILSGTGISTLTSDGGGFGARTTTSGGDGGSGGGAGVNGTAGGAATGGGTGYAGGSAVGSGSPEWGAGGGGGAGAVGDNGVSANGGDGGIGISNDITGSATWYAGGGGGNVGTTDSAGGNQGAGANGRTQGGGGKGTQNGATGIDGTANTGGGGGGRYGGTSGAGGSGIVVLRRLTAVTAAGGDLTLQSTDSTAQSEPDYGEFVTLMENGYGTATLNTDIKGYISRDSGTTFTQGTLLDEGTWGTNKKILAFHDLDISAQPSGTSMCYKITTHNQSIGSKETNIYATSIGWR